MPNYPGTANSTTQNTTPPLPEALYADESKVVFNAEQPVAGTASIAIAIGTSSTEGVIKALSVEGFFSAAPGVFEIDLETADVDADAFYQKEGTAISAVNATTQAFRAEFANVRARFARLRLVSRTNAVNLTARIIR